MHDSKLCLSTKTHSLFTLYKPTREKHGESEIPRYFHFTLFSTPKKNTPDLITQQTNEGTSHCGG